MLQPIRPEPPAWPDSPCVGRVLVSPNHGARPAGLVPDCLILHYTGMADGTAAIAWLCNPASEVSSHYVVETDGAILQLVPEARRAWHAGRSLWRGETDLNSRSIGIEIVNGGHDYGLPPYPAVQIAAVIDLCRDIVARHAVSPERVLGHSDIAPQRKRDPGEHFPWERLWRAGIGLWVPEATAGDEPGLAPGDAGPEVAELQRDFAAFGYGLDVTGHYDAATEIVVRAFQRHFRVSRIDGAGDAGTRATLRALV